MSRTGVKKARTDENATDGAPNSAPDGAADGSAAGGQQPAQNVVPEQQGDNDSSKMEDGLSFWVASKTVSFKLDELEMFLKKAMLAAGFSVEECSVSMTNT